MIRVCSRFGVMYNTWHSHLHEYFRPWLRSMWQRRSSNPCNNAQRSEKFLQLWRWQHCRRTSFCSDSTPKRARQVPSLCDTVAVGVGERPRLWPRPTEGFIIVLRNPKHLGGKGVKKNLPHHRLLARCAWDKKRQQGTHAFHTLIWLLLILSACTGL